MIIVVVQIRSESGLGISGGPAGNSSGDTKTFPGPVQPVSSAGSLEVIRHIQAESDIANVRDAETEAEARSEQIDDKVAAAAVAMERVTVEEPPKVKMGTAGKSIPVTCNYLTLELDKEKKIFEYEVSFEPRVDSRDERFKLIKEQSEVLGPTRNFDGVVLFLPFLLKEIPTILKGELGETKSPVNLIITLKHVKKLTDSRSIQFYNVLFRRICQKLKMVEINKNYYQPALAQMVPQHKLEIWPGFVTAVEEYEGGLMLNLDVSHKVLRTQTAYELMRDIMKTKGADIQSQIRKGLLGAIVLTR